MSKFGKWIGGGLGWAVGGPIGAIVGFAVGSLFDNAQSVDERSTRGGSQSRYRSGAYRTQQTTAGDFGVSMVILSAAVMRADNRVMRSELDYVKNFFRKQFGEEKTKELVRILREVLEHDISVRQVCMQIRENMSHPMRLQLLHYLFGIAYADDNLPPNEWNVLNTIARYLGISQKDFQSIHAMFGKTGPSSSEAYQILEISSDATNEQIKKAYRKMAVKYHPDKVASLGEEFQKAAKEKFQKVQEAYEQLKKERGFS